MSTAAAKTTHTPEDLLRMPDADYFELVDGKLVERKMGARSSYVATRICVMLSNHCTGNRLGWVLGDGASYQCFPHAPSTVRKPDTSYIPFGRLPREELPEGHIRIAPALAVEVVSPNDLAYEIDEKVQEFLTAGVALVWVINPATRTVRIHRPDRPGVTLRPDDELTGDEVLPGFRCKVADLFEPPVNP
jgi:Uma2 family endonuclease